MQVGLRRALGSACLIGLIGILAAGPAEAATIVVNSLADPVFPGGFNDGLCNLREAIRAANLDEISGSAAGECAAGEPASTATDTIVFTVAGTIAVATLPPIDGPVLISGFGTPANPTTVCPAFPPTLTVVLDGTNAALVGLSSSGAGGSTFRGLVIQRFTQTGILLNDDFGGDRVQCNFIGTDASGGTAAGNANGGVTVSGSPFNTPSFIGTDGDEINDANEGNGRAASPRTMPSIRTSGRIAGRTFPC